MTNILVRALTQGALLVGVIIMLRALADVQDDSLLVIAPIAVATFRFLEGIHDVNGSA